MQPVIVLLVGNPAVGKSTVANCVLGSAICKSGVSKTGRGITQRRKTYDVASGDLIGHRIVDTPGTLHPEWTATELNYAVQSGCEYKVVFVVNFEGGEIRASDQERIDAVLASVEGRVNYGVIINKVPRRVAFVADKLLVSACDGGGSPKFPEEVMFLKENEEAKDMENVLLDPDDMCKITSFIANLPCAHEPKNEPKQKPAISGEEEDGTSLAVNVVRKYVARAEILARNGDNPDPKKEETMIMQAVFNILGVLAVFKLMLTFQSPPSWEFSNAVHMRWD